ncbi:MAG: asparagine synthase-related protein [Bryobacteraceae bacterium]|jgi:asparagine synthase (glutamine-hydrolysing)
MAAILGALFSSGSAVSTASWKAALDALAARPGPCQRLRETDWLLSVFRARGAEGYWENESCAISIDGFVESTTELMKAAGPVGRKAASAPAEVLAYLYGAFGPDGLACLTGHFAAAIIDAPARCVYLVSDFLGSRTLYYAQTGFGWCWASEIKFLLPLLDRRSLNREGISSVFHYRWHPLGTTLLEGVKECLPSHWVRLSPDRAPEERRYVNFRVEPEESGEERTETIERTNKAFDEYFAALRERHPRIGVLLSGGVDSSLLAAKAREHRFEEIVAVTARWPGHDNPELERATQVAGRLKLPLRVIDVPDAFVAAYFPHFVWRTETAPRHYSAMALAKIFQDTGSDIDLFVSGEGADNLFGPAEVLQFQKVASKQRILRLLPPPLRALLAGLVPKQGGGRLRRLGDLLRYDLSDFVFLSKHIEYRTDPHELAPDVPSVPARDRVREELCSPMTLDLAVQFQHAELHMINRSHALDYYRFSAPHGTAVEMPFLLSACAELGRRMPLRHKIDGSGSKPVLKELLCRYLPREWVYAPKLGFPAPLHGWLAGPLAWWSRVLADERTRDRGLYRDKTIQRLRPDRDADLIWTALTLELGLRQFVDGDPAPAPAGNILPV